MLTEYQSGRTLTSLMKNEKLWQKKTITLCTRPSKKCYLEWEILSFIISYPRHYLFE